MTGKIILIAVGLVGAALLVRALIEPYMPCLTRLFLPFTIKGRENPGLALRILFFSDLHYDMLRVNKEKLQKAVRELAPDLILFGGDLSARPGRQEAAAAFLASLRPKSNQALLPFLAVAGNHDTAAGLQALSQAGIKVLQNESFHFSCRGRSWQISGLQDKTHGPPDGKAISKDPALPPRRHLILSHNPDNILGLPAGLAGYFLAGHFHGGQIWLPCRWEFFLLRKEQLPRQGIYKGFFSRSGMDGYISRGLGCVLVPLRLFSRPELVCLDFHGIRSLQEQPSGGSL